MHHAPTSPQGREVSGEFHARVGTRARSSRKKLCHNGSCPSPPVMWRWELMASWDSVPTH